MSTPVLVDCQKNIWVKVASGIREVTLHPNLKAPFYRYTWRATGDAPPLNDDDALWLPPDGVKLEIHPGIDVYVKSTKQDGKVRVAISNIHTVNTDDDTLNVRIVDPVQLNVARDLVRETGISSTLSAEALPGNIDISIQPADYGVFNPLDRLFLKDSIIEENNYRQIITKLGSPVLRLDCSLDGFYPATTTNVLIVNADPTSIAGSITDPILYKIQPPINQIWKIVATTFLMEDSLSMDTSTFGGISGGLANGVCAGLNINGVNFTLGNFKTNGDFLIDSGNTTFPEKAPAGQHAKFTYYRLPEIKSAVILDGSQGDFFWFKIQDNITSITSALIRSHGYIVAFLS